MANIIQPADLIAIGQACTLAGQHAQENPYIIPPAQAQAALQPAIQAAIGPALAQINGALEALAQQLQEMGQQLNQRLTAVEEGLQGVQASLQEDRDRRDRVAQNEFIVARNKGSAQLLPLIDIRTGIPIPSPPFPQSVEHARAGFTPANANRIAAALGHVFPPGTPAGEKSFVIRRLIGVV